MYRAKGDRDQSYVRFEVQMHDALLARVQAEADLRQAVGRGDLVLHYQPVVELAGGRVVGVEALVRWNHPELGLVAPGEFIDLAEETGLVHEIGRWALQESCRLGARWQRHAGPGGHFKVAVNVSARQLEPGFGRHVHDALAASGLPGSALTLEMTESVLMARTDEVVALLRRMRTLGVRVAVDDFGTGYSSLSYLSRFPVDILKIDKSFVHHLGDGGGQGELVRTIVRLGESLRLDTVAEGIETQEQRAALQAMGCTFGQGYLFARPLPADEVDHLLDAQALAVHDAEAAGGAPVSLGR
jgi:EAL domain-containing protein (putative c-di-GMP-specific phosphodiesterase class I)